MRAELVLSRSSYRAGSPVVGTCRIHYPPKADATQKDENEIRDDLVSARLYLAGRSYLGNTQKVSTWRSTQEISNLHKLYGDHPCLRMAKMEEISQWQREQNDYFEDNDNDARRSVKMSKATQPPEVTHIEQAERLAIHSHLHPKYNQYNEGNDYSRLPSFTENNTICFFMTNVLELLDLPERPGSFHDMDPFRPLHLPDLNTLRDTIKQNNDFVDMDEEYSDDYDNESNVSSSYSSSEEDSDDLNEQQHKQPSRNATMSSLPAWQQIMNTNKACKNPPSPPLERNQIALSFRTELPTDLPPTFSAECVKYFYSAVLVVTTASGEILVATCPFAVLTANSPYLVLQKPDGDATAARVHIGELRAVAHSNSLPTLISSTDVSTKLSQLNVIANPPVRSILSRRTAEQRTSTHRIQGNGGLCGLMTLVGFGGPISPGTRLAVFVDFPNAHSDEYASTRIIGCHRVCCGLVGEEYAICETGVAATSTATSRTDNQPATTVKRKTRSYVFDSAYEMVEFGHTDRISMGLLLPSHCPVTFKTDLVEVTVTLKVEFIVDRVSDTTNTIGENTSSSSGKDPSELGVISLNLPCQVVHSGIGLNEDPEDKEEGGAVCSNTSSTWRRCENTEEDIFDESDLPDLAALSLEMIKSLG